jgi:hypothetical protein
MANRFTGHRSRAVVASALVLGTLTACSADQTTGVAGGSQLALSLGTPLNIRAQTSNAGVVPIVYGGNVIDIVNAGPERINRACVELTGVSDAVGYKIETPPLASLANGGLAFGPVGVYGSDGTNFEWKVGTTVGVIAVLVKGGPQYSVYSYNGLFTDSRLASPFNASGAPAMISHVVMCYHSVTPPDGGGGGGGGQPG